MKAVLIPFVLASALPAGSLLAQEIKPGLEREVVVNGFIGAGSGPTRAAFAGGGIEVAPLSGWAIQVRFEAWDSGFGVLCVQTFPESYACDASGWDAQIGLTASPVRISRLVPFLELSGGLHTRKGPLRQTTRSPMVSVGLGTRLVVSPKFFLRMAVRQGWIQDQEYDDLMDEGLRLSSVTFGAGWRIKW